MQFSPLLLVFLIENLTFKNYLSLEYLDLSDLAINFKISLTIFFYAITK